MLRKTYACETKAEREGSGPTRYTARVSTPDTDRDGEILDSAGGRLDKDAPTLYGHDYSSIRSNIGKVTGATFSADAVINEGEFDDDIPEHTEAIIAAAKARKKRLQKSSIGFIPEMLQRPDGQVLTLAPGQWAYSEFGTRYLTWLQVELSYVPVGSNPSTDLLMARGFGAPDDKPFREFMRKVLEELAMDDEFLDRLATAKKRAKSTEAPPAETPGTNAPADAATGDELDRLFDGAEPERVANESTDPALLAELVARGAGATTDIDELFDMDAEPETAGAGAQGSAQT